MENLEIASPAGCTMLEEAQGRRQGRGARPHGGGTRSGQDAVVSSARRSVAVGRGTHRPAERRGSFLHAAQAVSASRHSGRGAGLPARGREVQCSRVHGCARSGRPATSDADARSVSALGSRVELGRAAKPHVRAPADTRDRAGWSSTKSSIRSTGTRGRAHSISSPRISRTPPSSTSAAAMQAILRSSTSCISSRIPRYAGSSVKGQLPYRPWPLECRARRARDEGRLWQ